MMSATMVAEFMDEHGATARAAAARVLEDEIEGGLIMVSSNATYAVTSNCVTPCNAAITPSLSGVHYDVDTMRPINGNFVSPGCTSLTPGVTPMARDLVLNATQRDLVLNATQRDLVLNATQRDTLKDTLKDTLRESVVVKETTREASPKDEDPGFGVHLNLRSTSCGMTIIHKDGDRARLVSIPMHLVEPTTGRRDYFMHGRNSASQLSCFYVCRPHLSEQGCPLAEECPDIHVDKTYVEAFLFENTTPLCCGHHNCYFSRALLEESRQYRDQNLIMQVGNLVYHVQPNRLAFTMGLESLTPDAVTGRKTIDYQAHLCRLHLRSQCRWGKQCGNVHVCRETIASIFGQSYPHVDPLPSLEEIAARVPPVTIPQN